MIVVIKAPRGFVFGEMVFGFGCFALGSREAQNAIFESNSPTRVSLFCKTVKKRKGWARSGHGRFRL